MTEPKAIFLDMDGTILDHYNRVSLNTKEIIDRLRAKGIYVFIATGRGKDEIYTTTPEGFAVDGVISSNGMTGYLGDKKLFQHTLPVDLIDHVIEKARQQRVYYELFPTSGPCQAEQQDRAMLLEAVAGPKPDTVGINEWIERGEAINGGIAFVDRIEGEAFSKFYCFSKEQNKMVEWGRTLEQLKQDIPFSTSSSSKHNIEIMVAEKNKATGIQSFLDALHLTSDQILAIGDSFNDLQMFELAGQTVAMQNAPDEIKAITDEVTTYSCDQEGVYHYLNDRFLR
ncbi:HAD family hydrolase [Amphibacillus jilinensis]|uniref:HAD family hydrolase n=1 Tax=Amphibacillus jilinensis TaxID=1216008 RepID=UPI0002D334AB|nr:HAD family hydrolase [Amphibacillus jilinensis]